MASRDQLLNLKVGIGAPVLEPEFTLKRRERARPTRQQAEEAVRTLLEWAGDDSAREGLIDTPARVARAFEEHFAGYGQDPNEILRRTFEEVENYDDIVLLRDIRVESFCEHHMLPILGVAHVAYIPDGRVVGISKLAKITTLYAKRLQMQEKLTAQIASAIDRILKPKGVAVLIDAAHQCMTTRGAHQTGVTMTTQKLLGCFASDPRIQDNFFRLVERPR